MVMTDQEIQFVRERIGRACAGVSATDIANGLHNTRYAARVRLTVSANEFANAVQETFGRLLKRR